MTATTMDGAGGKAPWHLWAVGGLSLLWNAYGAYDYLMTQTRGEAYLREMKMTDAMIAYMDAMPAWTSVFWALGVWGSVAGSVLLLMRRRWAFHAFAVSLLGLVVSMIYSFLLSDGGKVMGAASYMYVVITAAVLFFLWYARLMTAKGVLR
ncbi:MAG TPA: hypothetical protein VD929_10360 [Caulobacteraceae bacterium]|nr:hypothetical protein [Caulobacteraceae bacterium]